MIAQGASSGIGAETAVFFSMCGARVVLTARDWNGLETTVHRCQEEAAASSDKVLWAILPSTSERGAHTLMFLNFQCSNFLYPFFQIMVVPGDLTESSDISNIISTTVETYGHIDILVRSTCTRICRLCTVVSIVCHNMIFSVCYTPFHKHWALM